MRGWLQVRTRGKGREEGPCCGVPEQRWELWDRAWSCLGHCRSTVVAAGDRGTR